ncbi:MAG TPA: NAD-dependent epimerase/dehydratase family protein [Pseudonocardiaceae bacterium]|nr:NAD-dependent epimerase/dehydratase family protein [Pseudonocardiaceae bacterium]
MRVLVLGGTRFVGWAVVAEALARGWATTVVNRGVTGSVPPGAEHLRGDRTAPGGLAALAGREWDAVVDTWAGAASAVADSARLLAGSVGHCVYVSSRSAYLPPWPLGITEDAPVRPPSFDGDADEGTSKATGELAARQAFGDDRVLVARTGLVLGPHEDVGRLPWWLYRMALGGDVVAPGPPGLGLQYVDVRDLAAWLLASADRRLVGTFNALSTPGHTTMGELLGACRDVTGSDARLRWVSPDAVLAAGVAPWSGLPIWIPEGHRLRPLHETNADRAAAAGLRCRPVRDTVSDTWRWLTGTGRAEAMRWADPDLGIDPVVEAALLDR